MQICKSLSYTVKKDVFVKHNAPDNGQFQLNQNYKDKYFDTSRKILSQEMTMCNMEALSILSLRSYDQCQLKRSHHNGYSCEISKL